MPGLSLVSVEDVAARVNVALNAQGQSEVLESCIQGATALASVLIQSDLEKVNQADYYRLPYKNAREPTARIWASRQFLDMNTVKVYLACCGNKADRTANFLLADDMYYVNPRRGYMDLDSSVIVGDTQVILQYTAGFRNQDNSTPSWLKEAVISGAIYLHRMQAARHGKRTETMELNRGLYDILRTQLATQLFTQYGGFQPEFTLKV